ncbi:hypothetical protein L9F63_003330, partial [Diploptera punctata]
MGPAVVSAAVVGWYSRGQKISLFESDCQENLPERKLKSSLTMEKEIGDAHERDGHSLSRNEPKRSNPCKKKDISSHLISSHPSDTAKQTNENHWKGNPSNYNIDGCNATLNSRLARLAASRSLSGLKKYSHLLPLCLDIEHGRVGVRDKEEGIYIPLYPVRGGRFELVSACRGLAGSSVRHESLHGGRGGRFEGGRFELVSACRGLAGHLGGRRKVRVGVSLSGARRVICTSRVTPRFMLCSPRRKVRRRKVRVGVSLSGARRVICTSRVTPRCILLEEEEEEGSSWCQLVGGSPGHLGGRFELVSACRGLAGSSVRHESLHEEEGSSWCQPVGGSPEEEGSKEEGSSWCQPVGARRVICTSRVTPRGGRFELVSACRGLAGSSVRHESLHASQFIASTETVRNLHKFKKRNSTQLQCGSLWATKRTRITF